MENILAEFYSNAGDSLPSAYSAELLRIIEAKSADEPVFKSLFTFVLNSVKELNVIPVWTAITFVLLFVMLAYEIAKEFFGAKAIYTALGYGIRFSLAGTLVVGVSESLEKVSGFAKESGAFFGILAPTMGSLLALGGNVATAKTLSIYTSVLISLFEIMIYVALPYICTVFCAIAIIEASGTGGRMLVVSQSCKNACYTLFSFVTALYVILLGTQTLASSSVDSFSSRAVKLIVGNTVPIVGGTLGEALRLAGGGLAAVKSTLGVSSVLFLVCVYIPPLAVTWFYGVIINVFMFLCDYFSLTDVKTLFLHVKYVLNITLASYTSVFVMGMINIGIFMGSIPQLV